MLAGRALQQPSLEAGAGSCVCSQPRALHPWGIPWGVPWANRAVSCRVWDVNTGEVLNTLIHHNEAVLHLRFSNGLMVTCSKDRSIAVWDMASPTDITLRRVLVGHRAAVNVVDFDDKYIVSASGDRTIKVSGTALPAPGGSQG